MTDRLTMYEVTDRAAWITLNRPESRNAMNLELVRDLEEDLSRALIDPSVRCIVITGNGPAFCAGADLKSKRTESETGSGPTPFVRVLQAILHARKPVIAAVNGAAYAGGLGLVAAADIALCADHVKFSFSEVRIGVIPAIISLVCVPKLGAHRAMHLFLTGETIDANEAVASGLIHRAVPAAELRAAVEREIAAISLGGTNAVAECKQLVARIGGLPTAEDFAWAEAKSKALFESAEAAEGMAAFREKRAPAWTN